MYKGQKSIRGNIEDFLCPFTDMYITQGSLGSYSHRGIYANDVRGKVAGIRYPYYAPCNSICLKIYKESGQVMWQSLNKVRFANGRIDYATYMTAHDDTMDAYIGQIVEQGDQLGNMGKKGNATGIHCHIQISQTKIQVGLKTYLEIINLIMNMTWMIVILLIIRILFKDRVEVGKQLEKFQ